MNYRVVLIIINGHRGPNKFPKMGPPPTKYIIEINFYFFGKEGLLAWVELKLKMGMSGVTQTHKNETMEQFQIPGKVEALVEKLEKHTWARGG